MNSTLPYIPGQTFKGNVVFVQPHMDRQTRQLEVRLEFENPNLLLHAHVCQEHRALSGTSADRQPNDSHSVLYRTLVHPLVFLLVGVIVVTKVLGLW